MMKTALRVILTQSLLFSTLILFGQQPLQPQKGQGISKKDSVSDFEMFKKVVEEKISENEKRIEALKAKKMEATAKKNERFAKKIVAIEKRNNKLKRKVEKYSNTKLSKWTLFKLKVTREMKELGEALDDMSVEQYQLSQ
jgi:hypothetical protein